MLGPALQARPTQQEQEPAEDEEEKTEDSVFYATTDEIDANQA